MRFPSFDSSRTPAWAGFQRENELPNDLRGLEKRRRLCRHRRRAAGELRGGTCVKICARRRRCTGWLEIFGVEDHVESSEYRPRTCLGRDFPAKTGLRELRGTSSRLISWASGLVAGRSGRTPYSWCCPGLRRRPSATPDGWCRGSAAPRAAAA